ncbi:hypothetical protein DERF_003453 [Dermatophagoides farinae]|uniref:Uncharacterized protein n=1 Tax=Dermatophagoides farinae TaxID=6954 RepID=A0A922IDL8_DERFA|nr:hypothetical protein DERF_003453 [Dermatophagoides farinae]
MPRSFLITNKRYGRSSNEILKFNSNLSMNDNNNKNNDDNNVNQSKKIANHNHKKDDYENKKNENEKSESSPKTRIELAKSDIKVSG